MKKKPNGRVRNILSALNLTPVYKKKIEWIHDKYKGRQQNGKNTYDVA